MSDDTLPGLDDQTPPAGPFITDLIMDALASEARMELPKMGAINACKTNAEVEALYDGWNHQMYAFLMHATLAHVLIRIEENHPNLAAGIAQEVRDFLDAGDVYNELIWDWATNRGMDPEQIRAEVLAKHAEWLATVPRHLQTGVERDIP